MKKLALSFLIVLLAAVNSFAQSKVEEAKQLFTEAIPNNEHALSVLVAREGEILYQQTSGMANAAENRLADKETIFRIGSVTKQFTAAAIMRLAEQKKLSIEDPIGKYLPDFPKGDQVTIKHLLTHTSGLKSYTNEQGFVEKVNKPIKTKKLVGQIKELGYDFEPGEKWEYSNSGYYVLGYLVEIVSGNSYADFLQKEFFTPLKMNNSGVYDNTKSYKNETIGYAAENGEVEPTMDWEMTWAGGAGAIYSTVNDLYKWNQAIFKDRIFSPELLKQAHSKVKLNDGSDYAYGFGWSVGEYRGQPVISHGGGLHGFLSHLAYYPEIDATVVVLSNCSPPYLASPGVFSQDMAQLFFDEFLVENKQVKLSANELEKYVGSFQYPGGAIMTTSLEGGQLYAKLGGQPNFPIYSKGNHQFFWKVVEAEIEFTFDENGNLNGAIHKQGGNEFKVPKKEGEKEVVELAPGTFKKYSGTYDMNGRGIEVWEEDGKYYTQIQGQPKFSLYPKTQNRFFMKEMEVEIEFTMKEGKTEGLTIFQAGREIKAVKTK